MDDSGSINGQELIDAAAGHKAILDHLEDHDRFGLVGLGSTEPSMPLTLLDSATRATAATVIAGHSSPGGGTPMDTGMQWALDQFARPEIANDGRPHMIAVFSDGEWVLDTNLEDVLKATHPTIFTVGTIYGSMEPMRQLVNTTNTPLAGANSAAVPESRFFGSGDIPAKYQAVALALHSQVSDVDTFTIAPGTTKIIDYPIDSRMRNATIQVTWPPTEQKPHVTLSAPGGQTITPDSLQVGAAYSETLGTITYALSLPLQPFGLWKINITNPADGSSSMTSTPLALQSAPYGMRSASLQLSSFTAQASTADDLHVTLETAASSTLETSLYLTDEPTLHVSLLDATEPLTDTTFVMADLVDEQGITTTVILQDDGQNGDGAASDGHYAASLITLAHGGLYDATVYIRHFDPAGGYLERTLKRELFFQVSQPNLVDGAIHWVDANNADETLNPSDTINLQIKVQNFSNAPATNIHGTLTPTSDAVHLGNATSAYPALAAMQSGSNTNVYTFTIDPAASVNSTLVFEHNIVFTGIGPNTYTFTQQITLQMGTPALQIHCVEWNDVPHQDGTIDPGETISDDQLAEPDETFMLNLSLSDATNANVGTSHITVIRILDDDRKPTITLAPATISASEGDTVTMTVQLSEPARRNIGVDYATSDWNAEAGSDYTATSGTLDFAPGEISQTLSLPILTDLTPEPDELFELYLSNPSNATLGTPSYARVTIAVNGCEDTYEPDDDAAAAHALSVDVPQSHAFCVHDDHDWASFSATAGTTYRIETRNAASGVNTLLALYASDGTTLLAEDDDGGSTLPRASASRPTYREPTTSQHARPMATPILPLPTSCC